MGIGYRSLDKQATTCLFQLISERYERDRCAQRPENLRPLREFLTNPFADWSAPSNCIMSETGIPKASQRRIRVNRAFTPRALRRG